MSTDNPFGAPEGGHDQLEYPMGDREPARFDIGSILTRCWELVLEQPIPIIGTLGILLAVGLVFGVPGVVLDFVEQGRRDQGDDQTALILSLVSLALTIVSVLVNLFFTLGATRVFAEIASGNEARVSMVFGEGHRYLSGLGAQFLLFLIVFAGLLCFIVPGIIAAIGLQFVLYCVVQQGLGPIEALKESWALTEGYKLQLFLINLVISVLGFVLFCCTMGFGALAAWPVLVMVQAVMYHSLLHLKYPEGLDTRPVM